MMEPFYWCKIQEKIQDKIREINQTSSFFDFTYSDGKCSLTILTKGSTHGEFFAYYNSKPQNDKKDCLIEAFSYIESLKKPNSGILTYEIIWSKAGETNRNKSHLNGFNLSEIIDKFYCQKNKHEYIIYNMVLMPES